MEKKRIGKPEEMKTFGRPKREKRIILKWEEMESSSSIKGLEFSELLRGCWFPKDSVPCR
jgi:hypothetical protein